MCVCVCVGGGGGSGDGVGMGWGWGGGGSPQEAIQWFISRKPIIFQGSRWGGGGGGLVQHLSGGFNFFQGVLIAYSTGNL